MSVYAFVAYMIKRAGSTTLGFLDPKILVHVHVRTLVGVLLFVCTAMGKYKHGCTLYSVHGNK